MRRYQLIIIGSGPAGLTAGLYAHRYQLKSLVIGEVRGGTMATASVIENYPGFKKVSGKKLTQKMVEQFQNKGGKMVSDTVVMIKKKKGGFEIKTQSQKKYRAQALIIATGTKRRRLEIPGEKKFLGRGVSYCATCDAPFFKEKRVAVVGGANAAAVTSLHLASLAQKVYLIYRRKPLRADPVWVARIQKNKKIKVVYQTNIIKILGNSQVSGVELDRPYQRKKILRVDGVFIEIGGVPTTMLVKELGVVLDKGGFIKVGPGMETNVAGVFAAGDITTGSNKFQQIITACAEGALAAASAYRYLKEKKSVLSSKTKGG